MSFARALVRSTGLVFLALLCIVDSGCGSGSTGSTALAPLKDKDAITAALPKGVTLESAIVADPVYGASAKTVEEALANLMAYARDGKLYDGGLGREIRFEPPGGAAKGSQKSTDKKGKKGAKSFTTIKLAQ
jgi:hypothetical protein